LKTSLSFGTDFAQLYSRASHFEVSNWRFGFRTDVRQRLDRSIFSRLRSFASPLTIASSAIKAVVAENLGDFLSRLLSPAIALRCVVLRGSE
jgi:hypothetical protein